MDNLQLVGAGGWNFQGPAASSGASIDPILVWFVEEDVL